MCSFLKIQKFFALGVIVVLTISCSKYSEELYPTSGDDECRVEITFGIKNDPFIVQSRALTPEQESQILDVNLYAVHSKTGEVKHQYIRESSNVVLSMYTGTWTLYAFANSGYDMGETTAQGLEVIVVDTRTEDALASNGKMRMAKKQIVEISDNLSIRLELERLAAKVQISVSVSAAISDQLIIQGVQMCNVPISARYIGENNAITFYDYAKQEVSDNAFSRTYYLPENLAGEIQTITKPEERSPKNTPDQATFIRIEALYNGSPAIYYAYPGENQTTDFNLRHNHNYILNITLHGANPEDLRVSTYDMTFTLSEGEVYVGQSFSTRLRFTAFNNGSNTFNLAWRIISGEAEVSISGGLPDPPGVFYYGLSGDEIDEIFDITITSEQEGPVELEFYSTDQYNQTFARRIVVNFLAVEQIDINIVYNYGVIATALSDYEKDLRSIVSITLVTSQPLPASFELSFDYYWTSIYTQDPYNKTYNNESYTISLEAGSRGFNKYLFDVDIDMLRHPIYHIDGYYRRDGYMILEGGGMNIISISDPPVGYRYHIQGPQIIYRGGF